MHLISNNDVCWKKTILHSAINQCSHSNNFFAGMSFRHAAVLVNDILSYECRLAQSAHLERTSLYAAVNCRRKYRHGVPTRTATRCLLNSRHKSLLNFPETCATVISFCMSTLSRGCAGLGKSVVSWRIVGYEERKGRGWQSPLTIARSTEVKVHADGKTGVARGKWQGPPGLRGFSWNLGKATGYGYTPLCAHTTRPVNSSRFNSTIYLPLWLHSNNNYQ